MSTDFVPAIARQVHRGTVGGAAIVLPAAGAVTTLADSVGPPALDYPRGAFQVPYGVRTVTFWLTYTEGTTGGAVAAGAMISNGTEVAREPVLNETIDTTAHAGYGQQVINARDLVPQPAPGNGAPVVYSPVTIDVQPGWTVWLQAAEVGQPGTPGSLLVALTGAP